MRRIAIPRVEHVGIGRPRLFFQVGDFKGRSLVDRRCQRAVLFLKALAAVNRFGLLTMLMFLHMHSLIRYAFTVAGSNAGTGENHCAERAWRPLVSSSNACCSSRVTGPDLPVPTVRKSISLNPTTSAAVPHTNTSSAM